MDDDIVCGLRKQLQLPSRIKVANIYAMSGILRDKYSSLFTGHIVACLVNL